MEIKKDKSSRSNDEDLDERKSSGPLPKLFIQRDQSYEDEENIETCGVYEKSI